jgi:hypothetical protein
VSSRWDNAIARLLSALWRWLLLTAAAGGLMAQDDASRGELLRIQRELQQNRSEVERLLDLRRRHDLGLPPEEAWVPPTTGVPASSDQRDRLVRELREQEAATAALMDRWNLLRQQAEQLRQDAAAQVAGPGRDAAYTTMPAPGVPLASPPPARPAGEMAPVAAATPATPAAPAAPSATELLALPPPTGVIHGAEDRLQVAQALLRAGQALAQRAEQARQNAQAEVAAALDQQAKERLVRALDELSSELAQREPGFAALYFQGCCRELLFRHAERYEGLTLAKSPRDYQRREQEVRDSFLAITARDVQKQGARGEIEVLGSWGRAATAAMEHFRWMNVHGSYQPKVDIDAITWSGDKAR